jgi:hypothetical protein
MWVLALAFIAGFGTTGAAWLASALIGAAVAGLRAVGMKADPFRPRDEGEPTDHDLALALLTFTSMALGVGGLAFAMLGPWRATDAPFSFWPGGALMAATAALPSAWLVHRGGVPPTPFVLPVVSGPAAFATGLVLFLSR